MPPSQEDFWLSGFILSLAAMSVAAWFVFLGRMRTGPVLAYEPRRPVPWGPVATLLAAGFVALAVASGLSSGGDETEKGPHAEASESAEVPQNAEAPQNAVSEVALNIAMDFALAAVSLAAVVVISKATRIDLGLPEDFGGFLKDVKIGILAWLVALAPVYGTQILLVTMFGQPPEHPLIKMVAKDQGGSVLLAAFLAAVIAAPICEEIFFRLLLQGWLEKWEDWRLGWRKPEIGGVAQDMGGSVVADGANAEATALVDESSYLLAAPSSTAEAAPIHGLAGLPHGWAPILISSAMFAMAHFGVGPDPIPLFLLALVLGYVYQRTHRIVPSMVTHALFNSLTLIALWRMLSTGEVIPQ